MPKLIDAEQFYKELAELYQDIGWDERDNHISLADIKCNLELMPTVDAVKVVRCKECKFGEHWYRDKALCFLWNDDGVGVFEDGYCNYGERREDAKTH